MSYRSSTLIRLAASETLSTARERLGRHREQLGRHRELAAVLMFTALVLIALLIAQLTALLTDTETPTTPAAPATAPAALAPPAPAPTAPAKPHQATGARPNAAGPPTKPRQAQPPAPQPDQGPRQRTYQVRPGDTLASIALRHGVEYQRIASDNRLTNTNLIRAGQTLRIGQPTSGVRLIQPGDTLTGLARTTALTIGELRTLNPWITNPNCIPAGAGLRILP